MLMTAWGSNAGDERPEYDLLVAHGRGLNATVIDSSSGSGLLAIQGPGSRDLLAELTGADLEDLRYMWATPARVAGIRALISRTGYTGELGYELLIPAEHAHDFWTALFQAGEKHGLVPCGMIAAFGLRMEKGYIMRFDFAEGRTPYELGLGWTVKPDKGDFIGREALIRRKEAGFEDRLVNLAVEDGYVPAGGDAIQRQGRAVGQVTSSAYGYAVGSALALGYVPRDLALKGEKFTIRDGAGRDHPAAIVDRSPYDPQGKRLRA
jgi:aminomethyltransferase